MSTGPIGAPPSTTPKRPAKMASSQSLNHLLNFSLPPRQTPAVPRRSRKYGTQHGVWNKERFVNAQYRFVMNPAGDYTVHFADPDIFFQWQDILQVLIPRRSAFASAAGEDPAHEEGHTTCPICLSPPTAPRMTKCGHVYCFPCILHLINTSDNKCIRCPICFDSVIERQLKAVKWFDTPVYPDDELDQPIAEASSSSSVIDNRSTAPRPGSMIRMRLMQRPQITTLALPRSPTWPSDLIPPHQAPFHFLPDVYAFSKFMLATPSYLIEDLSKDLDELATERRLLAGDDLGLLFVDSAETKLRTQMANAAALETVHLSDVVDRARRDMQDLQARAAQNAARGASATRPPTPLDTPAPTEFLAALSPAVGNAARQPVAQTPPSRNNRQRRNLNPPPPSNSTYYYYQAASGMPIFLHPLDIRILVSHFSSYASFPDTISVRAEAFNEGTVNDDLRKRCKYLAHMPEGADVVFLEADLEGVVGQEGLRSFDGLIKARRARRKEKGRKDDKARAKAEERERDRQHELQAAAGNASSVAWSSGRAIVVPLSSSDRELLQVDEFPAPDAEHAYQEQQPPQAPGVWGARSFAAALHAPAGTAAAGRPRDTRQEHEDDWEADGAWQELEQRISIGGGRKKRGNRMVVLGGGGGRRR